jgi:hypothetical protein
MGKAVFRNCLVTMRPKTRTKELPTTHDVIVYLHNAYIKFMNQIKESFNVSCQFNWIINMSYCWEGCTGENLCHCRCVDCRYHQSQFPRYDWSLDRCERWQLEAPIYRHQFQGNLGQSLWLQPGTLFCFDLQTRRDYQCEKLKGMLHI